MLVIITNLVEYGFAAFGFVIDVGGKLGLQSDFNSGEEEKNTCSIGMGIF